MKKQKSLHVGTAMLLALSLVASGCSSSGGGKSGSEASVSPSASGAGASGSATPQASQPAAGADYSKQLSIKWLGSLARGKIEDNNKVQQMIEKKFNVKLENKKVDLSNNEQSNLMIASGELPEIAFLYQDPFKLYSDGMTRTVPKALIEKYAPNYAALLNAEATGWKINKAPGKDNEYVALTGSVDAQKDVPWLQLYRLDWMEKFGYKPKGQVEQLSDRVFFTKTPFTLEEEEKMFDSFVNGDPDGNGQKDTYAITMNNENQFYSLVTYAGAFGFPWAFPLDNGFIEENGKAVEFSISTKYRDLLKKLADWYKKGYIDPEFTTLNLQKSRDKYAAGKYGVSIGEPDAVSLIPYTMTRPPGNLVDKDPKAKFLVAPGPVGPGGQGVTAQRVTDTLAYNVVVNKSVSDEKLIRMLQIMDYINFDKEAFVFTNFGEAGTDFTWDGEPYKSAAVPKDTDPDREKKGIAYYNFVIRPASTTPYYTPKAKVKLRELYTGTDEGKKTLLRPYKYDRFNETKLSDLRAKLSAKLKTITDEYFFKAIIGEVNIDSTWNGYVDNWLKNGGSDVLAEIEKAPKVADLLKK
ncbi:type 2 periplasmic-binding domain-containing protein [Paenibacillus cymbidii]|uniref:ABC transporter substrate-binding protein n=1 Tax=Paenibacillus cymbidii TaxID=1639034 RepID=UPI00108072CD|nr:ABC transporter substrate-binding protein [Paenibacillus cymbidii]